MVLQRPIECTRITDKFDYRLMKKSRNTVPVWRNADTKAFNNSASQESSTALLNREVYGTKAT
jgi:hypothetical protein